MSIWALADLHLAKSVPSKNMAIFGPAWEGYMDKMEKEWKSCIDSSDLVLLPGDISWAMRLDEAVIDLEWIHSSAWHQTDDPRQPRLLVDLSQKDV